MKNPELGAVGNPDHGGEGNNGIGNADKIDELFGGVKNTAEGGKNPDVDKSPEQKERDHYFEVIDRCQTPSTLKKAAEKAGLDLGSNFGSAIDDLSTEDLGKLANEVAALWSAELGGKDAGNDQAGGNGAQTGDAPKNPSPTGDASDGQPVSPTGDTGGDQPKPTAGADDTKPANPTGNTPDTKPTNPTGGIAETKPAGSAGDAGENSEKKEQDEKKGKLKKWLARAALVLFGVGAGLFAFGRGKAAGEKSGVDKSGKQYETSIDDQNSEQNEAGETQEALKFLEGYDDAGCFNDMEHKAGKLNFGSMPEIRKTLIAEHPELENDQTKLEQEAIKYLAIREKEVAADYACAFANGNKEFAEKWGINPDSLDATEKMVKDLSEEDQGKFLKDLFDIIDNTNVEKSTITGHYANALMTKIADGQYDLRYCETDENGTTVTRFIMKDGEGGGVYIVEIKECGQVVVKNAKHYDVPKTPDVPDDNDEDPEGEPDDDDPDDDDDDPEGEPDDSTVPKNEQAEWENQNGEENNRLDVTGEPDGQDALDQIKENADNYRPEDGTGAEGAGGDTSSTNLDGDNAESTSATGAVDRNTNEASQQAAQNIENSDQSHAGDQNGVNAEQQAQRQQQEQTQANANAQADSSRAGLDATRAQQEQNGVSQSDAAAAFQNILNGN